MRPHTQRPGVVYWDHVRGVQAAVEFAAGLSCVPRLMEEALLHEKQCAGVKITGFAGDQYKREEWGAGWNGQALSGK